VCSSDLLDRSALFDVVEPRHVPRAAPVLLDMQERVRYRHHPLLGVLGRVVQEFGNRLLILCREWLGRSFLFRPS